ncbi:MAG: putative signal transduction protein containing a rane domain, an and a domain, partial [Sporomusa sp.]|nr:putative signal transduction protein containing a rane domain, an and a domain [Sporomusa sp.]
MKLMAADSQLEQIINLRREAEPNYQLELPLTFIIDKHYRLLYANIAYRLLYKMEPESFVSTIGMQLGMESEQINQIRSKLDDVFTNGKTRKFVSYINTPRYGKRAFEFVVNPLYNNDGNIEAVISTARDITAMLAIEEEQRKQKQLYKNLVENYPDIIARHDRNHRYLFINSALERLSGISPSE